MCDSSIMVCCGYHNLKKEHLSNCVASDWRSTLDVLTNENAVYVIMVYSIYGKYCKVIRSDDKDTLQCMNNATILIQYM